MKKTLVFNAPHPYSRTLVWDISSRWLRERAYIDLFKILDRELDAYSEQDSVICALIQLARNDNPEACEALLVYRRNRKGEMFQEIDVRTPSVDSPVLSDPADRVEVEVVAPTPSDLWDGEKGILPPIEALEAKR